MHSDLRVREIARMHRGTEGSLLSILKQLQSEFGYLPREVLSVLARETGIPLSQIYATVTFYSLLTVQQQGRYFIRICESPSCQLHNKEELLEAIWIELGIIPGETTPDGTFTLEFTSCLGQCDKGPALMVNGDLFTKIEASEIKNILDRYSLREEVHQ